MTTATVTTTQIYQLFIKATPEQVWDAITKAEFTTRAWSKSGSPPSCVSPPGFLRSSRNSTRRGTLSTDQTAESSSYSPLKRLLMREVLARVVLVQQHSWRFIRPLLLETPQRAVIGG